MGVGQPYMKGKDTGFGTEADKSQHKNQNFGRFRQRRGTIKAEAGGMGIDHPKGCQYNHRAHLGKNKVEVAGLAIPIVFIIVDHEKKRRERHDLPTKHKGDHVRRGHDQGHGSHQKTKKKIVHGDAHCFLGVIHIMVAVDRGQEGDEKNGHQEKGRQPVHSKGQAKGMQIACR